MRAEYITRLISLVGDSCCLTQPEQVISYSQDASFHDPHAPDAVVLPQSTEQIQDIMRFASEHQIPVTAWGGGSGLEGNAIPVKGGIVLDMKRMNRLLAVEPENFTVRVQPGIIGDALNQQLKPYRLVFPAQPGSANVATIGGMIANNAGGMQAVRYGVVGDWVLQLTVVLATGELIQVGSQSFKSVAGYDLKRLFIGSEGTLGIITEALLKVTPLSPYRATYLFSFPSIVAATEAIQDILHQGMAPASVELMDPYNIVLLNQFLHLGWKEEPTVIVEFHEKEPVSAGMVAQLHRILSEHQGSLQQEASTEEQRMAIWKARWSIRPAIRSLLPGTGILPGDVGLPLQAISRYLEVVRQLSGKYAVKTVTFGHAGDGNFHTWVLYTIGDKKSVSQAKKVAEKMVECALACGGTCTAEHGVGMGKRRYLSLEHPTDLAWMKQIKQLFDPAGILNPGKMFLP